MYFFHLFVLFPNISVSLFCVGIFSFSNILEINWAMMLFILVYFSFCIKSWIKWYSFLSLCGNVFFSSRYIGDQLGHDATDIGRRHLHCIGPTTIAKDEKKESKWRRKDPKKLSKKLSLCGTISGALGGCWFGKLPIFPPWPRGASFSYHCRGPNIQIWQNSNLKELKFEEMYIYLKKIHSQIGWALCECACKVVCVLVCMLLGAFLSLFCLFKKHWKPKASFPSNKKVEVWDDKDHDHDLDNDHDYDQTDNSKLWCEGICDAFISQWVKRHLKAKTSLASDEKVKVWNVEGFLVKDLNKVRPVI